jgi:hypothetical protein
VAQPKAVLLLQLAEPEEPAVMHLQARAGEAEQEDTAAKSFFSICRQRP